MYHTAKLLLSFFSNQDSWWGPKTCVEAQRDSSGPAHRGRHHKHIAQTSFFHTSQVFEGKYCRLKALMVSGLTRSQPQWCVCSVLVHLPPWLCWAISWIPAVWSAACIFCQQGYFPQSQPSLRPMQGWGLHVGLSHHLPLWFPWPTAVGFLPISGNTV